MYFPAKSSLNHVMVNGSEDGLRLTSAEVEFNAVQVYSSRYGAEISNATVSCSDCTFSSSSAISLDSLSAVTLTRCLIVDSYYGIVCRDAWHWLNITDCSFRNNRAGAIYLEGYYYYYYYAVTHSTLLLRRSVFAGNLRAVYINQYFAAFDILFEATDNVIESADSEENLITVSGFYINLRATGSQARVALQRNIFRNLPYSAISISRCYGPSLLGNIFFNVTVTENNFDSMSETAVKFDCLDNASMLIQSNTFRQNRVNAGSSCLSISLTEGGNTSSAELRVNRNEFRENSGTLVGNIIRSGHFSISPGGSRLLEFVSNTFVDNTALDSTIYSEFSDLNMHFNAYSNQRARFELRVGFPAEEFANCTYNWWGVSTEVDIAARIFDYSDMTSVGTVLYVPFLKSLHFTCTALSDCSGHGRCVHHDTCLCDDGWSGVDCSVYSCSDVYDCSNRGQCVGPNFCRCDSGWLQPDCSRASCLLQNNCSNRGVCYSPNV